MTEYWRPAFIDGAEVICSDQDKKNLWDYLSPFPFVVVVDVKMREHFISFSPICCQASYFVVDVFTRTSHVIQRLLFCWCQMSSREHVMSSSPIYIAKCLTLSLMSNVFTSSPICCQASYFDVDVKCLHRSMSYHPSLSGTKCLTLLSVSNVFTRTCHINQLFLLASILLRCRCLHESMSCHPVLSVAKRLTSLLMSNVFTRACYINQPYLLPSVLLRCWCQMSSQEYDIVMSSSPICVQVSYFVVDVNCI